MGAPIDMSGRIFGILTVLGRDGITKCGAIKWLCRCECGSEKSIDGVSLRRGASKSCGCTTYDNRAKTHGMTGTKVFNIWRGIKDRCLNPRSTAYKHYGGRGIDLCAEWMSFERFYSDMGDNNGLTIDRIDNEKGYSKDNCRWASMSVQMRNRRVENKFGVNGISQRRTKNFHAGDRKQADKEFYRDLKDCGVNARRAWLMYRAVRTYAVLTGKK